MAGLTLPERVAQFYYTYGLFCSSYPATAITFALFVVLICCYPLLNVPLPGNVPTVVSFPLNSDKDTQPSGPKCFESKCLNVPKSKADLLYNESQKLPHIWAKDRPLLYIQQIILRIGVSPWNKNLKMWDAFRAPLQEVFRLLEQIRNHQDIETKNTLNQHCYQVGGIRQSGSGSSTIRVMPEYSCLVLSPANLWQQNLQTFSLDANIVNTIHNYQNIRKGKASIAEMAFGMQLRDSGIKRYPMRARPRVLQYAVTIFYERYDHSDERFIQTLNDKLKAMYPLYQNTSNVKFDDVNLIYYPGQFNYLELVPLIITFVGLFLYVYFSVRKIEFIKSKLGLAACAVVSVAGSLSMSMGICYYFGFSLSHQGKEIFPYLVIIVGLENILVLTKSVTSTDTRLDVKIRLAQGLSKEGWSITKNFLTEITIFTVSLFTFVPFIQEFSIFMMVSLISDFFIQMFFFATILGIDVRHMEHFQDKNNKLHLNDYFNVNNSLNWRLNKNYTDEDIFSPQKMTKSKSHPRLNGLVYNSPTDVVAKRNSNPGLQDNKVPKRIRLVNMWARTRFFQRAFMFWMIVWLSMIVYNSGIVEYFIGADRIENDSEGYRKYTDQNEAKKSFYDMFYNTSENSPLVFSPILNIESEKFEDTDDTIMLKHCPHSPPWSRLSTYHWSAILSHYNVTVAGRYVVILPPVLMSHRVSPELAVRVRNPEERDPPRLRWQALAAALDPIDIGADFEPSEGRSPPHQWGKGSELPIYPTTPMEILLLAILCTISVGVIAYMMVVLYRCVCSRHYAEWRASWNKDEEYKKMISKQPAFQLVMEAVPLVVAGHSQEVECLVTDGEKVVSSCLQGNIKVWDSENGEIITNIDRGSFFKLQKDLYDKVKRKKSISGSAHQTEDSETIEDTSNNVKATPLFRKGLSGYLSGLRFRSTTRKASTNLSAAERTKYNFVKNYRQLYRVNQRDPPDDSESKENEDTNCLDANSHESDVSCVDDSDKNVFVFDSNIECASNITLDTSKLSIDRQVETEEYDSNIIVDNSDWKGKAIEESPVWCMDFCNDLIIIGCADGRVEFWEASSGKLMCVWWSVRGQAVGVTHVRALAGAWRICVASLSGHLTLLRLDGYNTASGAHLDWRFCTAHRRTHKRTGSADSLRIGYDPEEDSDRHRMGFSYKNDDFDGEEVVCVRLAQSRPHQQPITELQSEGGRIVTGGYDHVLKVYSSTDLSLLFTLHGHCGPITSCFIDHTTPIIAGSGSQDGLLCVWDLHTGACEYSMQAHDGAVTSLAYTASYVVSAGADERLCIWDRFQGHMLNSIHIGLNYMSRMLPLTHTLLVIGDRSGLTAYDLSSGDVIRRVLLGQSDGCTFVRQILPLKNAIVCDYANQLRIVRFPLVSSLSDMKTD